MKYVLIIVLVLIGGIIWSNSFYGGKTQIETVRNIPLETSPKETSVVTDDTFSTSGENELIEELKIPTDVGMEYPETDMTTQGNASAKSDPKILDVSGENLVE